MAITEQQVFEGAAHPFSWKPKLRIPDIYENRANQQIFGHFLIDCLGVPREDQVLAEVSRLAAAQIKGWAGRGQHCLLLVPAIALPFDTAMVNDFNVLFNDKKR